MRRLLVLAALTLVGACAHVNERWGDEEETSNRSASARPKDDTRSDGAAPPVSFVVASNDAVENAEAPDRVKHEATTVKPSDNTEAEKPGGTIPVIVQEKKGKEIPVIIEKPQPEKLVLKDDSKPKAKKEAAPPTKEVVPPTGVMVADTVDQPAEKAAAPEKQDYDRFQKLDREMARNERTSARTEAESAPRTASTEPEEEERPAPPPPRKKSTRNPNWMGLSILVGAGELITENVVPGYGYNLAYGGQVAWNPAFAGDFALDVGFWRSGKSTSTGFNSVETADNNLSLRIMYLPTVVAGFYVGLGVGAVGTYTQAHYKLATSVPSELDAGAFRFGGDGTVALGYRIWHVEARIDLRTLYMMGNRLEFLPTGTIGATF